MMEQGSRKGRRFWAKTPSPPAKVRMATEACVERQARARTVALCLVG